jgi:hypothetical protein
VDLTTLPPSQTGVAHLSYLHVFYKDEASSDPYPLHLFSLPGCQAHAGAGSEDERAGLALRLQLVKRQRTEGLTQCKELRGLGVPCRGGSRGRALGRTTPLQEEMQQMARFKTFCFHVQPKASFKQYGLRVGQKFEDFVRFSLSPVPVRGRMGILFYCRNYSRAPPPWGQVL